MSKVVLPAPHPGQVAVRSQAKRFNWLSAGRRWRKTTLVMGISVEAALQGKKIIWGAPVYDQSRIAYEETRRAVAGIATPNISRMTWDFPTGGQIVFRSLDNPDNVRGHTADGVVIDEAADVSPVAWQEALRPMLIDTGGWAWIIGTPKGLNWFHHGFADALTREDSAAWQAPTLGAVVTDTGIIRAPHPMENPDIPWSEVVHLYETLPSETFQQEVLAEFIQGSGAVFRNVESVLTASPTSPAYHRGHIVVAGVDLAQKHDFTAVSIYCCHCNQELHLDRWNQLGWEFQRTRLLNLIIKWGVEYCLIELNSIGQPNFEALLDLVPDTIALAGFDTTAKTKPKLIQQAALAIEKQDCAFLPDAVGKFELVAYECEITASGHPKYGAPEGGHDDTVMARCLAIEAKRRNPLPPPTAAERWERKLPDPLKESAYIERLQSFAPAEQWRVQVARTLALAEIKKAEEDEARRADPYGFEEFL